MDDYTILKKLATGGQGTTFLVQRQSRGDTLVLKQCKCENLKEANSALKESKMLQSLNNRSIVQYYDVFLDEEAQYLIICTVMEYCPGGDLAVYMNKLRLEGQRIPEGTVIRWTLDMARGLDYLHGVNVVHRDMKPLNIFMTGGGNVKIGDFGLAASSKREKKQSQVGTPCYLSPEILQNDAYGPAVDVWGAGCIVLEMMTFEFLWERRGMLSVQVLSRPVTHEDIPGDYSRALKSIAISTLQKEPENRPKASEMAHRCSQLLQGVQRGAAREGAGVDIIGGGIEHFAQGLEAIWKQAGGEAQSGAAQKPKNAPQAPFLAGGGGTEHLQYWY